MLEVQEVGAVDEVLVAREVQGAGAGAGGDQEAVGVVGGVLDLQLAWAGESGAAVQGGDAMAAQAVFHVLGHGVGEAVLVLHQVGPVDGKIRVVDALAAHQPCAVDDLGPAAQDLLRIAPPQRARASVGQGVHDGHLPSLRCALVGGGDTGHAGADDDQVELFIHLHLSRVE